MKENRSNNDDLNNHGLYQSIFVNNSNLIPQNEQFMLVL